MLKWKLKSIFGNSASSQDLWIRYPNSKKFIEFSSAQNWQKSGQSFLGYLSSSEFNTVPKSKLQSKSNNEKIQVGREK